MGQPTEGALLVAGMKVLLFTVGFVMLCKPAYNS